MIYSLWVSINDNKKKKTEKNREQLWNKLKFISNCGGIR